MIPSNRRGTAALSYYTTCGHWNAVRFSCQGNLTAAPPASILQLPLFDTAPNIHILKLGWLTLLVYPRLSSLWHCKFCILGKASVLSKKGQLVILFGVGQCPSLHWNSFCSIPTSVVKWNSVYSSTSSSVIGYSFLKNNFILFTFLFIKLIYI